MNNNRVIFKVIPEHRIVKAEINDCEFDAEWDKEIDGKPYDEVVKIAKEYIESVGGFEKFAEWGLF